MTGRILGPNIPFWQVAYPEGSYMSHQEGCKGRIIQQVHRNTQAAVGRPFCEKCERFVGKKAWRQFDAMLTKGLLDWTNMGKYNNGYYRLFTVATPPEVEQARELIGQMDPHTLREYVRGLDPELVDVVESLRKRPPGQPRLEEPPAPGPCPRPVRVVLGHQSGPVAQEMKKKAIRRKIRRRRRY